MYGMIKQAEKEKNGELGKFRFISKEEGTAKALISGEFYDDAGELIQTNFNNILIRIDSEGERAVLAQEEGENLNNPNLNLENLAVQNILLYPPFDTTIQNYDIEISNNINELNILAIPENEQSKVEILGNSNLKEGNNRIIITVTSLAGERREYIINGYKRNSEEEQIYLENKEKEQEQLKEIYKTQHLSNNKNDSKQQENKIYIGAIIVVVFAVIGSIITFRAYKKYH